MRTRAAIAILVFMLMQAVLFGVGAVLVLATPMADAAWQMMPWVVGLSIVIAIPIAWMIAPRLRARNRHERVETTGKRGI